MVSPETLADFWSSATMALLSAGERVGVARMLTSLGSLARRFPRPVMALAVGSRALVLTAAVYYIMCK